MKVFSWCSRRVGGLSLLLLISLCSWILLNEIQNTRNDSSDARSKIDHQFNDGEPASRTRSISILILAYYSLFIHILVAIFPFRACWAIWDVTRSLKAVARQTKWKTLRTERKLSSSSLSSAETLTLSRSSSNSSDTEDLESGYCSEVEADNHQPIHTVLIPNYKEDVDILRETLDVLASHPQARSQYDVSWPYHSTKPEFQTNFNERSVIQIYLAMSRH
jgi:hypothetical protein